MKTAGILQWLLFNFLFCLLAFGPGRVSAQTSNTCVSPLSADYITKYEIIEAASYVETNSAGPVPNGSDAFLFEVAIDLATNLAGTASTAVLSVPGGQPILMKQLDPTEFVAGLVTNAFTNIAPVFPDGTYQFTIFDNPISVTLPAGATLPNPPTLSDYISAQSIDAGKDYSLGWEAFVTGGAGDFISVTLMSDTNGATVFKTGDYRCPSALDGTATSVTIPANTLSSNTTYQATFLFVKVYTYDTTSISETALLAGTESAMATTISTGSASARSSAPVLANAASLPGGGVRFDISTTPGLSYTIQFSSDLNNPSGWKGLQTTVAAGRVFSFTNSPALGGAAGFYRVLQQ